MPDFNPTPIILVYPLDGNSNPTGEAQTLFHQPSPPACDTDALLPSPNGSFLAVQYNCYANQFIHLLGLEEVILPQLPITPVFPLTPSPPHLVTLSRGYFLDWSPDGNWLLFRNTDTDTVSLVSGAGTLQTTLDNLLVGSYEATFAPDGQQLWVVASAAWVLAAKLVA